MERISLGKKMTIKSIIFAGLENKGYALVERTSSRIHPIYLFHDTRSNMAAIYHCRMSDDELIMVDCSKSGKLDILIKEYTLFNEPDCVKIASLLEDIKKHGRPGSFKVMNLV